MNGGASVTFTAGSNGGAVITNYEYSTNGSTWTAFSPVVTSSPVVISGLTNGTSYSIYLRAINAIGNGSASSSTSITPARTAPQAPSGLVGTGGDGTATISFTAGSDGGSTITNYEYSTDNGTTWVTPSPAVTSSPLTIAGLTNGTSYQMKIRGVNAIGTGTMSAAVAVTLASRDNGGGGGGSSSSTDSTSSGTTTTSPTEPTAPAPPALDPVVPGSNPAIPASGVPLGGSVLLVNGQVETVVVKPDAPRNAAGLEVEGTGFTMKLAGLGASGQPLGLTNDGALILQQDRTAVVEGTGFKPNSDVELYAFSTPRFLGSVKTDAEGNFKGTVPLPTDIPEGRHTLQSNGFAADGAVRSLSLGVLLSTDKVVGKSRVARTTVFFDALSARLSSTAKASLKALVKGRGASATRSVVVGYVQPAGTSSNDKALSTQRAKAIAAYLRSLGLKGTVTTRGDGVAKESGAAGRKAVIAIRYVR
jgi:outer membrane protein OmpA-like peptidoglycan-associated protein